MVNTRSTKTVGPQWVFQSKLSSDQMNHVEDQIVQSIDGYGGGTYNPSAFINIGGSGIRTSVIFRVTAGGAVIDGGLSIASGILFGQTFAFMGGGDFNGAVTFNSTADFGVTTFGDVATFNDAAHFADVADFADVVTLNSTASFNDVATFNDDARINDELIMGGTAKGIRENVEYAPDADHTYSVGDATVIVWQASPTFITGAHTIKINDATSVGATLKLINCSDYVMTLHNESGGNILNAATLPAINGSSLIPGVRNLIWINNGTYTGWTSA